MNKTQLEEMGVQLSQKLEWDGFEILEVARNALTDANFHKEAKVVNDMLKSLETDLMNGDR